MTDVKKSSVDSKMTTKKAARPSAVIDLTDDRKPAKMGILFQQPVTRLAPTGHVLDAIDPAEFYKFESHANAIERPMDSKTVEKAWTSMQALIGELAGTKVIEHIKLVLDIPAHLSIDATKVEQIQYFLSVYETVIWPEDLPPGMHLERFTDDIARLAEYLCVLMRNLEVRCRRNDESSRRDQDYLCAHADRAKAGDDDSDDDDGVDALVLIESLTFAKFVKKTTLKRPNNGRQSTIAMCIQKVLGISADDEVTGVPETMWGLLLTTHSIPYEFFSDPTSVSCLFKASKANACMAIFNQQSFIYSMTRAWASCGVDTVFLKPGTVEVETASENPFTRAAELVEMWLSERVSYDADQKKEHKMLVMTMPETCVATLLFLSTLNKELFKVLFRFFDLWALRRSKAPETLNALEAAVDAHGVRLQGETVKCICKESTMKAINNFRKMNTREQMARHMMDRFYVNPLDWKPRTDYEEADEDDEKEEVDAELKNAKKRQAENELDGVNERPKSKARTTVKEVDDLLAVLEDDESQLLKEEESGEVAGEEDLPQSQTDANVEEGEEVKAEEEIVDSAGADSEQQAGDMEDKVDEQEVVADEQEPPTDVVDSTEDLPDE